MYPTLSHRDAYLPLGSFPKQGCVYSKCCRHAIPIHMILAHQLLLGHNLKMLPTFTSGDGKRSGSIGITAM